MQRLDDAVPIHVRLRITTIYAQLKTLAIFKSAAIWYYLPTMRVVNTFVVFVLISVPVLWVWMISVSLYQAISGIYAHADQIALHAAYGQ